MLKIFGKQTAKKSVSVCFPTFFNTSPPAIFPLPQGPSFVRPAALAFTLTSFPARHGLFTVPNLFLYLIRLYPRSIGLFLASSGLFL